MIALLLSLIPGLTVLGMAWFATTYVFFAITMISYRHGLPAIYMPMAIPTLILDVGFNFTYGYLLGARTAGDHTLSERLLTMKIDPAPYRPWQNALAGKLRRIIETVEPDHFAL